MRTATWLFPLILLGAQASWAESASSPPPDYRPPDTREICPALAEDYDLCRADLWSGNCADFVDAARRLGAIYRSELRAHPGWVTPLRESIWWGCGEADFTELRALLERIRSPQARAVLAEEPYRSLAEPRTPAAGARPPQEPDCTDPSTVAERNACAARVLARARAEHERAFADCKQRVAPGLRGELVDAETSWERELSLECAGEAYVRDECLANAYQERTASIGRLHPECARPGS